MLERPSYFVAIVVMLGAPGVAGAQVRRTPAPPPFLLRGFFRSPPDAGTGPYLTDPIIGEAGYNNVYLRHLVNVALDIVDKIKKLTGDGQDPEQFAIDVRDQLERLNDLGSELDWQLFPETVRGAFENTRKSLAQVASRGPLLLGGAQGDAVSFGRILTPEVVDEAAVKAVSHGTTTFKLGALLPDHSTSHGFASCTMVYPEQRYANLPWKDSCFFLTASASLPMKTPTAVPVIRAASGFALGDPDSLIASLSLGTYFRAATLDAQGSVSLRAPWTLNDHDGCGQKAQLNRNDASMAQRLLLDHVRPGDVWLGGTARAMSTPGSSWTNDSALIPSSDSYEGSVTFALPQHVLGSKNLYQPTTIAFSGTWCNQRASNLDEMGIEVRTPVGGKGKDAYPTYFSARYGTRGDFTLALETRL